MLDFVVKYDKDGNKYLETSLWGKPLLTTPQLNKGTAFTAAERHDFGLTGKLPIHIETLEQQAKRAYHQYSSYTTNLKKNTFLNKLHDTNQVLFYKLIEDHEAEMLPIVYTPTVGDAIQQFSGEFQQARGLYINYEDRHHIDEILDNRSNPEIDVIVTTDGGGVLGIGDQGVGAMLIPVAKLMVYTICGGINPLSTLPILLDVGTDNETLLNDPFYLGWRHPRITNDEYDEFIELFVNAIKRKFPHVFLHWEDFGRDNARRILDTYRDQLCTFNDDIQGTGAVTLAALLAAVQSLGSTLNDQRIVIFGGGTAGTGIADQICEAMQRSGMLEAEARSKFWIIDKQGLLLENMNELTPAQRPYARRPEEIQQWGINTSTANFLEVVTHVKPTILVGCSTVHGAFNREIVQTMAKAVDRPIIFPLSNPTHKAEAVPQDLIEWTDGRALIATGSPFEPVIYKGRQIRIAQCNNALIFPGIGLGVISIGAKRLTNNMLWMACRKLSECAPIHRDENAPLLPPLEKVISTATAIALEVANQALKCGVAHLDKESSLENIIHKNMWHPHYLPFYRIS